jgi:hypothetical protein
VLPVDLVVVDHMVVVVPVLPLLVILLRQQIQIPHQMVLVMLVVLVHLHKVLVVVAVLVLLVQHLLVVIKKVVLVEQVFSCHPHSKNLIRVLDSQVLVVDIGSLVVEEVVQVHLILMLVVEVEHLKFQDQIKAQICPLPMYLHMSGLVQDQVFKIQVQRHDLPVLTLVQVVVVLVPVLAIQQC